VLDQLHGAIPKFTNRAFHVRARRELLPGGPFRRDGALRGAVVGRARHVRRMLRHQAHTHHQAAAVTQVPQPVYAVPWNARTNVPIASRTVAPTSPQVALVKRWEASRSALIRCSFIHTLRWFEKSHTTFAPPMPRRSVLIRSNSLPRHVADLIFGRRVIVLGPHARTLQ
jgi:hypothetical protein